MGSCAGVRLVAALLAALTWPVLAAEPQISNRTPQPDEIGYRPADGATVRMNPPSLTWLHEGEARTYSVEWSRKQDFGNAVLVTNVPFNVYTHSTTLPAGQYFWRYRFAGADGKLSGWSRTRRFTLPPDAVEFPMPTRAEQRQRVPHDHPRLFMRPENLPALRELARGREADAFATLRAVADGYIAAGPTPEPAHLGSATDKENQELIKYWWLNRQQTEQACREAETIAFVYLLSGEKKYGDAARKWILHLVSWNPDGPTNFKLNCEAAKPMLYRLPRAYDWAWDTLTEPDREKVRAAMARRALDAWNSGEVGRGVGHLNRPFSSHGNRTWHKLAECAIAFLGEIPEAETWLDYAVNKFYAAYPVWSDDDGGWHEGVSYWGGYLSKVVNWLQVAESALQIDGFKKPFFAQIGDYPLYVAPPGSPNMGFGDLAFRPPPQGWGGFIEYFLRAGSQPSNLALFPFPRRGGEGQGEGERVGKAEHLRPNSQPPTSDAPLTPPLSPSDGERENRSLSQRERASADRSAITGTTGRGNQVAVGETNHAGYWRWWTEQWKMTGEAGVLGFLYDANLPALPPAKAPTDLPASKVFRGIGVASLHTTLTNSADDVHLLFKSSPFGSQSHGHSPQNTFQLNAYGAALLTTCGYRDLHGSKFHYQWVHSTKAHNGVLVEGEGQVKHSASAVGRIADFQFTPGWDYVLGDATPAYGGRLTRARRQIVFVKPDLIVICDDLAAPKPATFQFMLHALESFHVDEKTARLSVRQPQAALTAQYLSPVPLKFRQWDGFDPKPTREFPNQWHVEAGTQEKRTELRMITVLVPRRSGQPEVAWQAERLESDTAIGVRVVKEGRATLVALRKAEQGKGSLGGSTFDGAVNVAPAQ